AMAQAVNITGVTGIKVSILPPHAEIHDRIIVDDKLWAIISSREKDVELAPEVEKITKKKSRKKVAV
ncbi:MAG TPA: hypothetical protein VJK03_01735, partial [Candidatus Nanoarchaeia archaeon]|nr:hypothetical protein [Candidatus Nanoarchaeia archaeon]